MEGTVTISIKDFEAVKEVAKTMIEIENMLTEYMGGTEYDNDRARQLLEMISQKVYNL